MPDPVLDIAVSQALLQAVAEGYEADTLRLTQPPAMVAFGKLDRVQDGFTKAVQACQESGAVPVLRLAGGRAAAFHPGCLGLAWARWEPQGTLNTEARFALLSELLLGAIGGLGVDARRGEVPGEYCPGDSTINARGEVKLVGVGQRSVSGASHLGGVVVCENEHHTRRILEPVYQALGASFDPASCGSVHSESAGSGLHHTLEALQDEFTSRYQMEVRDQLPDWVIERAYGLVDMHRLA
jgi:lipoate-protein ligase A